MSLNRWAKRRDSNEGPLVSAARELGAQMEQQGPLDWWCGWRGQWFPVEVKAQAGKYTDDQIKFLARCREHDTPVHTWRSLIDVYNSLGARQTA